MEYTRSEGNRQLVFEETKDSLRIPSCLYGFNHDETTTEQAQSGRRVFCFRGSLAVEESDRVCKCGNLSCVLFPHNQFKCPAVHIL